MDDEAHAAVHEAVGLLERAVGFTLGCLHLVTPQAFSRDTPCGEWNLEALLYHLDDSFIALHEAVDGGHIDLSGPAQPVVDERSDLVALIRRHASQLVGAWTRTVDIPPVVDAGAPMPAALVASTGALEIAVHGWDVAQACGRHRSIPPALSRELLATAPLYVTPAERPDLFGAEVALPRLASPGDRLLAHLGRNPHRALVNRTASWLCRAA
ncbi:MAG: TIGR03086 family protein [Streptosporangiales bacterium]|nr:TIGR03086 family protein [Streptosporangiales bacterium]